MAVKSKPPDDYSNQLAAFKIEPKAPYSMEQARRLLGLRASSLPREMREGRLRWAKRCGRKYILGEWLLQWLREGEGSKNEEGDEQEDDDGLPVRDVVVVTNRVPTTVWPKRMMRAA